MPGGGGCGARAASPARAPRSPRRPAFVCAQWRHVLPEACGAGRAGGHGEGALRALRRRAQAKLAAQNGRVSSGAWRRAGVRAAGGACALGAAPC